MSILNVEDPCFQKDVALLSEVLMTMHNDAQTSGDKRKRLFKLLAHAFRASASLGVLYNVLASLLADKKLFFPFK